MESRNRARVIPGPLIPGASEQAARNAAAVAGGGRMPFALRPAGVADFGDQAPKVRIYGGGRLFTPPPHVPPAVSSVNGEPDTPLLESSNGNEFINIPRQTPGRESAETPAPVASVVYDVSKWGRTATIPFNLTVASQLALAAPAAYRVFLNIRNDVTSAGNVLIAFDHPAQAGICAFVLLPGGDALFDAFVPNGDLYLASGSTSLAVVTFANMPFRTR
jgi:hypothetical protein